MSVLPEIESISNAISSCETKEAHSFASAFGTIGGENPGIGWELLQQIFTFLDKFENPTEPFGPMLVADGKRSMVPDDLSDEQLDALHPTLDAIADPEYRARIGDVLWLRRRDPRAARIAVEAYLESGMRLEDPEHWTSSMTRYERAVRLARQVEPKGELPKKVLSHLQDRVRHYDGSDTLYFTCKALRILEEFRFGEFVELAEIGGRVADESRAQGNFRRARSYYDVQSKLLKRAGCTEDAESALVNSAECHVEEAEAREANGEFMAAHSFWGNAIRAFRDRESLRGRIPELQQRYSNAGEKTRDEMKTISHEIDISELVKVSREALSGLSWDDAFFTLVTLVPLIDPDELRASAITHIEDHPLQATIDANIFDAGGRKVGVRPSAITDDPAQYESAVVGFMEQNAQLHRSLTVHGRIAPAIQQILEEHDIDNAAVEAVVGDSGLIPEDRRPLFFDAFAAGFRWDFSTALHFLIPQIENALRQVLAQHGVTPTNVDASGIEEVWGLERILDHAKTTEIFGTGFVFELKSLLVERLGSNLRNLFAHGLLSKDAMNRETALYLWWIFLRLAALPTSGMHAFVERREAL